jgi:hypothetical protein
MISLLNHRLGAADAVTCSATCARPEVNVIRKSALIGLLGVLLLFSQLAFSDSLLYTLAGTSADEQHSYRNTISVGDELVSEQEHMDYMRGAYIELPFAYSVPQGFVLRSATIDFSLASTLDIVTTANTIPLPGMENDYLPANILPTVQDEGPMFLVTFGNEWFYLSPYGDMNANTSFDLLALGYGDLLRQGIPLTFVGVMQLFSYESANGPQWWGRNAIGSFSVDQYWSADYNVTLTLDVERVPEPTTLLLLSTGLLGLGIRRLRAHS